MAFRISELQEVLCACGRPRSGRKHELLGRALSLLRQSEGTSLRERVKNRIVELYRLRFPTRALRPSVSANSLYSSVDGPHSNGVETAPLSSRQNLITRSSSTHEADSNLISPSRNLEKQPSIDYSQSLSQDKYNTKNGHKHTNLDTLTRPQNGLPSRVVPSEQGFLLSSPCHDGMPVHPDVRFINLPFAELQDILIKPTSLGKEHHDF